MACEDNQGGPREKILLVNVFSKASPSHTYRIYAIMDKQSNALLISSKLADHLGADTPQVRYYLSTYEEK